MTTYADLTDRQIMIMICLRENKSIQEMCLVIGAKSYGTVQDVLKDLLALGLAEKDVNENGKTRPRGYKLTEDGKNVLKSPNRTVTATASYSLPR